MTNAEIKSLLKENKIPYWVLGEHLGKSENTIYRMLRSSLSEADEKLILTAVAELSEGEVK